VSSEIRDSFGSIADLARAVRKRKVSPVELIEETLAAAEREQPRLNAFIALMHENARSDARRIESMAMKKHDPGLLAGVPVSVKDLLFTRGVPTTAGSRIFASDYGVERDASVVRRLRRAGAIVFGKTNLHEIALGVTSVNEHFGPVRNPWDTTRVSGGSSGGSAAAVAARLGFASVGSDTRGSIRIPAACCGVTGLKPTYGLVRTKGVVPLAPSLDHVGPLTVSVDDAALLLDAMTRGSAWRDRRPVDRKPRRVVVGVEPFFLRDLDPAVGRIVQEAIDVITKIARDVREIEIPELPAARDASGLLALAEAASFHDQYLRANADGYGAAVRGRLEGGYRASAVDYLRARSIQGEVAAGFARTFEEVDLIVGAVLPSIAPQIDGDLSDIVAEFTRLNATQNMAGVPALSVPCGFADGMPVGLQIIGPRGEDARVLELGAAYQRATDWHLRRPAR
jgi:aspartyl-tRNA(Asn)/glutamyl-tRNA(Gln) amidotransferase subunit A